MTKKNNAGNVSAQKIKYRHATLAVSLLEVNSGQIDGLPRNPRLIKDNKFKALRKSVGDDPDMLAIRPVVVVPHGEKYVILGGNMRTEAARANGQETVPCIVIDVDTPLEWMREFVIKDNGDFGEWDWDMLANEWNDMDFATLGVDVPKIKDTERLSVDDYVGVYYTPNKIPTITLRKCIDTTKFDAKIKALQDYDLTDEQRETLKMFAYRFLKIDFESVANYYAFNATEEERKAMERLRLVLVDNGIDGFVEDDLLRISKSMKDE